MGSLSRLEQKALAGEVLDGVSELMTSSHMAIRRGVQGIPLVKRVNVEQTDFPDLSEGLTYLLHRTKTRRLPFLARLAPPGEMASIVRLMTDRGKREDVTLSLLQARRHMDGPPLRLVSVADAPLDELLRPQDRIHYLMGYIGEAGQEVRDSRQIHSEVDTIVAKLGAIANLGSDT